MTAFTLLIDALLSTYVLPELLYISCTARILWQGMNESTLLKDDNLAVD